MRKIIIDTDCGSDDAVAIMMALKSREVHVEAITTVCGNVPLELATQNTLMTVEVAHAQRPPVFSGAAKPLMRELVTAVNVHGKDGMGDLNLIHPTLTAETENAVDAIINIIDQNPYDIEIVALGPVTNIAQAILKAPSIMQKTKHIHSMGTAGFGRGNTTPVSEFNVYVDAEPYDIMLRSNIPMTIVGFDVCLGDAALNRSDMEMLMASGKAEAVFAVQCNRSLLAYNLKRSGEYMVDLPDAIAMGVVLWPEVVTDSAACFCKACVIDPFTYGQVIVDDGSVLAVSDGFISHSPNAVVCKSIDNQSFKAKLFDLLLMS